LNTIRCKIDFVRVANAKKFNKTLSDHWNYFEELSRSEWSFYFFYFFRSEWNVDWRNTKMTKHLGSQLVMVTTGLIFI